MFMFNTENNKDVEIIDNNHEFQEFKEKHKISFKNIHRELLNNTNESYIYTVNVDGKNKFYCNTRENAIKKMWKYARNLQFDWMNLYNCYISENNNLDSKISIFGTQRNCLITYDRLLHNLKIEKIFKIKSI